MIQLSQTAIIHFKKTLASHPNALGIRVGVKNAGCSDLSYTLGFATEIQDTDRTFTVGDVQIVVNADSLQYLEGMEIDSVQEGLNQHLRFNNPNAKGACGCGESFSVK